MSTGITGPEFRRTRSVLRAILGAVLALALVAAWDGLRQLGRGAATTWDTVLDVGQLIGTNWQPPAGVNGPLPWTLSIARLILPLAATAFVALLAVDAASWLRSLTRNHVIVVGRGVAASTLAARLQSPNGNGGRRQGAPEQGGRRQGGRGQKVLLVEHGDQDSLRSTGIRRAKMLVVCGDDDNDTATNVATTAAAVGLARRRTFTTHMLVGDPGLALALRARRLVQPDNERRRVLVFNVDELAARQHVRQTTISFDLNAPPHLLVVGAGTFARAVIVEFAKCWSEAGAHEVKAPVTLVAAEAEQAVRELTDRWPFVARLCDLRPMAKPLEQAMLEITQRPYRSYFCDGDDVSSLRGALTAATRWRPEEGSVVVRTRRLSAHSNVFDELFDNLGGALDSVSVYDAAGAELMRADDPLLAFAMGIHQRYLDDAQRRGEPLRSAPYLRPWDELPPDGQLANIAQAQGFPRMLKLIRCTVAPRTRLAEPFYFRPGEVETMARAGHDQWVGERTAAGWRRGAVRDYKRKVHPLLVGWDQLEHADRARNRAIVRGVPLQFDRALEREGLQIVRLAAKPGDEPAPTRNQITLSPAQLDRLGRLVHDEYVKNQSDRGVLMYSTAAMRPWDELSEDLKEANRAQASDIGGKLDLIEATLTDYDPGVPLVLTDDEIEMLARYEHERWLSERVANGWTYGDERDDDNKKHPLLVPWLYLTESKHELDRTMVRNIPALVAAAGLYVTR